MSAILPQTLNGAAFTTYRIGGPLQEAYQPATEADVITILKRAFAEGKTVTPLGWGGNTLIASAGISGVTLITRKLDWVERKSDTRFAFGAGVHLAKAATTALQHGLSGGEYMIGIPGTIGGAVRMNAGALGQETSGVVRSVTLFDRDAGLQTWGAEQLAFSYRQSAIRPGQHTILSAELEFTPGDPETIQELMEGSVAFRKTHHPIQPNGGSVFANPSKETPTGRLIDELGGKGQWREGGVMISPLHGNFIVNVDQGTSTDVLKLMLRMKQAIKTEYGLDVYPENLFLGDATDEEKALWAELTAGSPHA